MLPGKNPNKPRIISSFSLYMLIYNYVVIEVHFDALFVALNTRIYFTFYFVLLWLFPRYLEHVTRGPVNPGVTRQDINQSQRKTNWFPAKSPRVRQFCIVDLWPWTQSHACKLMYCATSQNENSTRSSICRSITQELYTTKCCILNGDQYIFLKIRFSVSPPY